MFTQSLILFLVTLEMLLRATLHAHGNNLRSLGIRSVLGLLTIKVFHWGLWGAWIALVADQLFRTVLMAVRYHNGKWKRIGASLA